VSGMEKAKWSYIRMERIDGENVHGCIDGDDPEELLSMLADGVAEVLHNHPRHWRGARRLFRRVLRDTRINPPWYAGIVDFWRGRIVSGIIGAAVLTGAIYALSYVAHLVGVC